MALDPTMAKAMLDWLTGAGTPVQPTQRWVNWATASPDATNGFDGPFTKRIRMTFNAAGSPVVTAVNANACSGTATAIATAVGWNVYESSAGGRRLMYGTLGAAVGCASGDAPCFRGGDLDITLV